MTEFHAIQDLTTTTLTAAPLLAGSLFVSDKGKSKADIKAALASGGKVVSVDFPFHGEADMKTAGVVESVVTVCINLMLNPAQCSDDPTLMVKGAMNALLSYAEGGESADRYAFEGDYLMLLDQDESLIWFLIIAKKYCSFS